MEDSLQTLIEIIHASPWRGSLVVSGGGSGAAAELLTVPGASATVLDVSIPYSQAAIVEYLGFSPEAFCSEATARALAMAAYQRAVRLAGGGDDEMTLFGLTATAALATNRPKRGPHRVHVAMQTAQITEVVSLELLKGRRTRAEEESLTDRLILQRLAALHEIDPPPLDLLPGEKVERDRVEAPSAWSDLLRGRCDRAAVGDPPPPAGADSRRWLLPGSFNPLHAGHREMAAWVERQFGSPVELELSIVNPDKPTLDFIEIRDRLASSERRRVLWLTRAATFVEKSAIFPNTTFLVGADTIRRIGQTKYYGGAAGRRKAIAALRKNGCRFLVFGRLIDGQFERLETLGPPADLLALCDSLGEEEFRRDISSTQLRAERKKP